MDQSYIKKSCLKTTTLELLIDVVTLERETTGSPLVRQHVSEATRSEWLISLLTYVGIVTKTREYHSR